MSRSDPRKASLRALVLLGVLGVCVAAAWWLGQVRGRPLRQANALLDEIRQTGLKAYWPEEGPVVRWYLLRHGSDPIGWEVTVRQPTEDGFRGGMLLQQQGRPDPTTSRWALSANASRSRYIARQYIAVASSTRSVPPRGMNLETEIAYGDDKVTVHQLRREATVPAPSNYIPKGLMSVVLRETVHRDLNARFTLLFDDAIFDKAGNLHFGEYQIEPLDPQDGLKRIRVQYGIGSGGSEFIAAFDNEGRLVRRQHPDGRSAELVTEEEIRQTFPTAVDQFKAWMQPSP